MQRREGLEEQRAVAILPEKACGKLLDVAMLTDEARRGFAADAGDAWIAVGRIADQREVVGDERRRDPEFRLYARGVANLAASAIDLDDAIAGDTLREILVRRPD